jgi:hypothetical protein
MSVELKINEIDNSNHENKIVETINDEKNNQEESNVLKLNSTNISDAIEAAEKLNLNVDSNNLDNKDDNSCNPVVGDNGNENPPSCFEKHSSSLSDEEVSALLIKQLLANKNSNSENSETSIEQDIKNLTSKVLKKHLIPSLKNFLSTLD